MRKKKIKNKFVFCALCLSLFGGTIRTVSAREMTAYPKIKLQTLDKGTARTMTFDAKVGNTLKFGKIYMKVLSCQKSAPTDQPESAAFIQIWEVTPEQKPEWVFSGWMFSSSPALSAMDHPLYDVWVVDCLPDENTPPPVVATTPAEIPAEGTAGTTTETPITEEAPATEEIPAPTTTAPEKQEDLLQNDH